MAKKKLPEELGNTRPALQELENVYHPSTGGLGPPPKRYSIALHEKIVELIRQGNRPHVAAGAAGLPVNAFYHWMKLGREGHPHLAQFAQDVELAQHEAETKFLGIVTEKVLSEDPDKRDPEYAKWWLERARADGYAKQVRVAVEQQLTEFLDRLEQSLPPEVFEQVLSIYVGHAGAFKPTDEDKTPVQH